MDININEVISNIASHNMEAILPELPKGGRTASLNDAFDQYIVMHSKVYNKSWKTDMLHANELVLFFGDIPLHSLNDMRLSKFISYDLSKGRTKATVNRRLSFLKAAIRTLEKWGYVVPSLHIRLFKESHKTLFFSKDEIDRLLSTHALNVPRGGHVKRVVEIALATGMRKEEILSLKWSQIDMKNRVITLTETKSGKEQYVLISDVLYQILENEPKTSEYVISYYGHRVHEVKKCFHRALREAGLDRPGICLHTLRHTFASHMAMAGTDMTTLKEFLRHSSITTTMRYAHLSDSHKRAEINKAGFLLTKKANQLAS